MKGEEVRNQLLGVYLSGPCEKLTTLKESVSLKQKINPKGG